MRCGARVFNETSDCDQQQLSMSMRPYTKNMILDVEAQQLRNPINDQLLHRVVRAIRKVSPMGSLWDV
jgi:hypothetical protein